MRTVIVVPHPPGLASGADMYRDLATACFDHLGQAIASNPQSIGVVAAFDPAFEGDEGDGGSLAAFGLDVKAGGPNDSLPPILALGAWYLDEMNWHGARVYSTTRIPDTDVVIVLADGSAKRSEEAPGFFDPRAQEFDDIIAEALAHGDTGVLRTLDEELAWQLWCYDVPALRLMSDLEPQHTELVYYDAPFGVGYWIAQWQI